MSDVQLYSCIHIAYSCNVLCGRNERSIVMDRLNSDKYRIVVWWHWCRRCPLAGSVWTGAKSSLLLFDSPLDSRGRLQNRQDSLARWALISGLIHFEKWSLGTSWVVSFPPMRSERAGTNTPTRSTMPLPLIYKGKEPLGPLNFGHIFFVAIKTTALALRVRLYL